MKMAGEQPEIKSTPYSSPMFNFGSSIIMMTNPEDELYKMELTFRSAILNEEGKIVSVGKPLMNELGISSVVGIVQSIVNRVTIMSNLEKFDIQQVMDFLGDTLSRDLMMNRKTYGISTETARDKIYFTTLSTAFMTMKRALQEGEKRFWKGSQQEITTRIEGQQKKSGLLGGIMGWRN